MVAACSSTTGEATPTPVPRTCTKDTIRYHAFLASGTCLDVKGAGGTWIAESAFPDAPPAIRDTACTYAWTPPSGASPKPDVKALEALKPELLTQGDTLMVTEPCAPPSLGPASVNRLAPSDTASPPTGVSGCDVCGRIAIRRVYVILPADRAKLKTFVVGTEGGAFVSYEVKAPEGARIFSVELPPAETSYVQGRVTMVEAPF